MGWWRPSRMQSFPPSTRQKKSKVLCPCTCWLSRFRRIYSVTHIESGQLKLLFWYELYIFIWTWRSALRVKVFHSQKSPLYYLYGWNSDAARAVICIQEHIFICSSSIFFKNWNETKGIWICFRFCVIFHRLHIWLIKAHNSTYTGNLVELVPKEIL